MNTHTPHRSAGFTVIELIVVVIILIVATFLFFFQKNNLQTANLDERRKTAVNSIYYNLEEVFYAKNSYYPSELTSSNLNAMDPNLLTDTKGVKISDSDDATTLGEANEQILNEDGTAQRSEYIYEPVNCDVDGKCKGYTLRVVLANEAEYIKKSRHN